MKTDDLHLIIDLERKALFRKRAEEMNLNISQYFEHLMDEKPMVPALLVAVLTGGIREDIVSMAELLRHILQ